MSVRGRRDAWRWVKARVGWAVFSSVAGGMGPSEVDVEFLALIAEERRKTMMRSWPPVRPAK